LSRPTLQNLGDTKRWLWHLIGAITAALLLFIWLPLFVHNLAVPHISTWWIIGWFVGSATLSVVTGYKASRWWFLVTACFGVTLILLWIGEAVWNIAPQPH
jgi:hypothetical protein